MERTATAGRGRAAATAAARPERPRAAEVNFERLRAPFSLRCGALLVDYVVLVGLLACATLLERVFGGDGRGGGAALLATAYLVVAAAAVLNFVVLTALSGRTLGKWVTGLHIERRDGVPLSFGRAMLRHLVGYPLTALTLGAGFLPAVFNPEGRALHDLLAGTVVVRDRG